MSEPKLLMGHEDSWCMDRKRNITGVAPARRSTQLKEGVLQNGLPELVVIPNDREGLAQKGVILFFQL